MAEYGASGQEIKEMRERLPESLYSPAKSHHYVYRELYILSLSILAYIPNAAEHFQSSKISEL